MKHRLQILSVFSLLMMHLTMISGQECVRFSFDESFDSGDLLVDIRVDDFADIMGFQFAISYPGDQIMLTGIVGNASLGISAANINAQQPGYIALSWSDASVSQTLADGSSLIQMRFMIVGAGPLDFQFVEEFDIEIFNSTFDLLCQDLENNILNDNNPQIVGSLWHDVDGNCTASVGDIPLSGWLVVISSDDETYYAYTNVSGNYVKNVPIGEYQVTVVPPNGIWSACITSLGVVADTPDKVYDLAFVMEPVVVAPALEVAISRPGLQVCEDNTYHVAYKNEGSVTAIDGVITLVLDDRLAYVGSTLPMVTAVGQTVSIPLGDIEPGQEGRFEVMANVDCDAAVVGEALCIHARIDAAGTSPLPSGWEDAVLQTTVKCDGDSIEVAIDNIGSEALTVPLGFIVIEDDVLFHDNTTNPADGEQLIYRFADKGGAYRVIAEQPDGYPYGSFTTSFVQSCKGDRSESYRFVSMFSESDDAPDVDVVCSEVRLGLGANEVIPYPAGYRDQNEIDANREIEYAVSFQNLGTDSVFHVAIQNEIDKDLDIEQIEITSASHDYTVRIVDGRILRFDMYNIALPDAQSDSIGSVGFISYRIPQLADLAPGTEITHTATILFDFVEEVKTETYTHRIAEDYIEIILSEGALLMESEVVLAPNPATDLMQVSVPETVGDLSYVIYDISGRVVNAANCTSHVFYINRGMMLPGMYMLEVMSEGKAVGRKRFVFH